jgi:hypothetical protein
MFNSIQISMYVSIIIILFFGILIYCYISNLNKINTSVEILQKDNPSDSEIQDLLVQKQPTIFADVLYEWVPIAEIFDVPLDLIKELLAAKPFIQLLEKELSPYSLLFSRGWKYYPVDKTPEHNSDRYFHLESNHRHMIAQITGIQRILIASPNQTTFLTPVKFTDTDTSLINKTICDVDFTDEVAITKEPFSKLQYIEIVLREGNLLYIPRGWWYLQRVEEPGLVLEVVNESLFS